MEMEEEEKQGKEIKDIDMRVESASWSKTSPIVDYIIFSSSFLKDNWFTWIWIPYSLSFTCLPFANKLSALSFQKKNFLTVYLIGQFFIL